jgi:phosphopantetheinyl transferase
MLETRGLEVTVLASTSRPAAYSLLRTLLAERLDVPEKDLSLSRSPQGKPQLDEKALEFSLSFSGTLCAIAIAPRGHAIGIDIERQRPIASMSLIAQHFLPTAMRTTDPDGFLVAWTVLEAGLKATGHGLGDQPREHAVLSHRTLAIPGAVCTVAVADCRSESLLAWLRITAPGQSVPGGTELTL